MPECFTFSFCLEERLPSHSSTFSSDGALVLVPATPYGGPEQRGRALSSGEFAGLVRWPIGAALGCALVVGIHLAMTCWVFPHPIARPELRTKVMSLTEFNRPRLIVAGDSRAAWHLDPIILARTLNLRDEDAVNIAINNGGSSAAVAAYREFQGRFARNPIMLLSVSIWSVNDGSPVYARADELVWSLGVRDRIRLVGFGGAVRATFSAEQSLMERWTASPRNDFGKPSPLGFMAHESVAEIAFSAEAMARQSRLLEREWYADSSIAGVRWAAFERDLSELQALGVRLVLVESPLHPRWLERISKTRVGGMERTFQQQMERLASSLAVALFSYDSTWLEGRNADDVYCDFVHLNSRGAELFSARVGRDLAALLGPTHE